MKNNITAHMIVRNEEQWVWYAIQSVLPYVGELLIYDTGSGDKTVSIIKSIKSKKIRFVKKGNVNAKMLVSLRNEQVKKTQTEWFLLIDGDEVWPRKSIQEHVQLVKTADKKVMGIVVPTRVCVGDLTHIQDERAGKYELLGKVGHFNIRLYRKKRDHTWIGIYPLEAYCDANGVPIQNKPEQLLMARNSYWHLSHLVRSSADTHRKRMYELGSIDNAPLLSVFSKKRPSIVPSPHIKYSPKEWLYALIRTPAVYAKRRKKLLVILIAGLLIRMLLTIQTPFSDGPAFRFWSLYLKDNPLASLFKDLPGGYTPYPPFYYYILKPLGGIISLFKVEQFWWISEMILRLPYYLADIGSSIIIFVVVKELFNQKKAYISAIFFLFHPALIITGTLWGQFDSIILFLSLIVVVSVVKNRHQVAWTALFVGALTKLQIIPLAPLLAVVSIPKWRRFLKLTPLFILATLLIFSPVIHDLGIEWTVSYFRALPHWYPYTSIYATNFWSIFGFLVSDTMLVFGVPLKLVSIAIVATLALLIIFPFFQKKDKNKTIYWAALLLFYTFSFWSTRVHSRYFVYMLPFLSIFVTQNIMLSLLISVIMITNTLLPAFGIGIDGVVTVLNQKSTIIALVAIGFIGYIWTFRIFLLSFTKKVK